MNLLIQWLASLFSSFKAKNPGVAAIVLFILATAVHTVHEGNVFGIFPVDGWLQTALEYVTIFLTAITGSQTWQILNKNTAANG